MATSSTILRVVGLTICLLLALPALSFACRCAGSLSPADAYHLADVVLLGKTTAVSGDINQEGLTAIVRVVQVWKQPVSPEIVISTTTTCAFSFRVNQDYLLYLSKDPQNGRYTTKACVGNQPIEAAEKALQWLKTHGKLVSLSP
jgi:hypothetical protein